MRSRPLRIAFDDKAMTAKIAWSETDKKYLSVIGGDADLLDNGDVNVLDSMMPLVGADFPNGYSRLREVDPEDNHWVWTMKLPNNYFAYRCIHSARLPGEVAN